MNDNTLDQIASMTYYIKDVNKLTYPVNVPYFKIISRKTYETKNSQIKITPQEYQEQHLARIGDQAKYEILDGTHFIYLDNVDRISEITDEFLSDISAGDDGAYLCVNLASNHISTKRGGGGCYRRVSSSNPNLHIHG